VQKTKEDFIYQIFLKATYAQKRTVFRGRVCSII